MNSIHKFRQMTVAVSIAALFVIGTSLPATAADELPEVSSDGLHLMIGTKVRAAYVKPGATLDGYTKVMLLDCFVQFKEKWQRDYNLREIGMDGRVSDKDIEEIKGRLADEFRDVFTTVLTEDGHEVVDQAGPNTLLLRPAIVNLDINAPDVRMASRSYTWVENAGEMTLFMELYDSSTSELLARVIDPQAARTTGARVAGRTTNKIAADQILREWASLLSQQLGTVKQSAP